MQKENRIFNLKIYGRTHPNFQSVGLLFKSFQQILNYIIDGFKVVEKVSNRQQSTHVHQIFLSHFWHTQQNKLRTIRQKLWNYTSHQHLFHLVFLVMKEIYFTKRVERELEKHCVILLRRLGRYFETNNPFWHIYIWHLANSGCENVDASNFIKITDLVCIKQCMSIILKQMMHAKMRDKQMTIKKINNAITHHNHFYNWW